MIQPPLNVKVASGLAERVQLRDVGFLELHARYVAVVEPTPGKTLTWDTSDPTVIWHLDGSALRVIVPFRLTIHVEPEGDSTGTDKVRLAEILVVTRLDYELKEGSEWAPDAVPHYAGISGFLHAWPYFRAEVQALTGKIGLPPLVLPVVVSGHVAERVSVVEQSDLKISEGESSTTIKKARKRRAVVSKPR